MINICLYGVWGAGADNSRIQSNFKGSNTVGTMKICSRQGQFELMSVNHSARTRDIIGLVFSSFPYMKVCCVF